MDLLMGGFADAALDALEEHELACFEALLDLPDHDVLAWLTGQARCPEGHDTPLFHKLKRFHDHAHPIHV
jgi:antitoxin CptB